MDTITLADGREVRITELRQYGTYHGHLAGLPDAAMSARIIERLLAAASELGPSDPHLIPPVPRRREVRGREGVRIEERLPPVACAASFDSGEIEGSGEPYSCLVVAWFQDRFGDADELVARDLAAIDWDRRAAPWCW